MSTWALSIRGRTYGGSKRNSGATGALIGQRWPVERPDGTLHGTFHRSFHQSFPLVVAGAARLALACTRRKAAGRHEAVDLARALRRCRGSPREQRTHPSEMGSLALSRFAQVIERRVVRGHAVLLTALVAEWPLAVPALGRRPVAPRHELTQLRHLARQVDVEVRREAATAVVAQRVSRNRCDRLPVGRDCDKTKSGEAEDATEQAHRHRTPTRLDARHRRGRRAQPGREVTLAEVGHPPNPHHEPSHIKIVVHRCLPRRWAEHARRHRQPSPTVRHSPTHPLPPAPTQGDPLLDQTQQRVPLPRQTGHGVPLLREAGQRVRAEEAGGRRAGPWGGRRRTGMAERAFRAKWRS